MRFLALVMPFLLLAACKGKDDEPATTTFATYNAGLAVLFVPQARERAPLTAQAVAGLDADFVCLQEVWLPEHVAEFESAVAGTFEHTYFPAAQQEEMASPACTTEDIADLVTCMADECGTVCDDELVDCLFSNCALQFLGLPKDCSRCAQANVGTGDPALVEANCTTGGQEYAYDGTFGTGIVSKYPIDVEEIVLDSTTNRRGLLHATVEGPAGDIDAWCTHLTAGLGAIPYPRPEGTWQEEQYDQAEILANYAADAPDPVVVLGDLNNGPTTADAKEEFPENYQLFLDAGLEAPYVDMDGRCTFCDENLISSADSDEDARLIDHILIRGFDKVEGVDRIFDEEIQAGFCGTDRATNLSDHFGITVTVSQGAAEE